jgi:RNA polymerase sigma-70 factor (ECF subfamily)
VLRLSFYEEQPHSQIAQALGLPLGTVKSRVRLAVRHLRRLLDGLEP